LQEHKHFHTVFEDYTIYSLVQKEDVSTISMKYFSFVILLNSVSREFLPFMYPNGFSFFFFFLILVVHESVLHTDVKNLNLLHVLHQCLVPDHHCYF